MKILRALVAIAAMLAPLTAAAQFTGVINGSSTSTQCASAPGLYLDQQNSVLMACGNGHVLQPAQTTLAVFPEQTAVTAVTTAQTLASLALNANLQNVLGRMLKVCGAGVYTSPGTTAPTLTLAVTEGGITPVSITTAGVSTTASTNMPFNFCFTIATAAISTAASPATTGTLEAHGVLSANITANTPAAAAASYLDTNTAVSSALNLFSSNTLAVTVAASSTMTAVKLLQMTVELVQ